jgi:hypothetical protein
MFFSSNAEPHLLSVSDLKPLLPGVIVPVIWMHPEWLHANFNKKSMGLSNAPNCPQDKDPADCNGFMYRVELKLNEANCSE